MTHVEFINTWASLPIELSFVIGLIHGLMTLQIHYGKRATKFIMIWAMGFTCGPPSKKNLKYLAIARKTSDAKKEQ